MSQDREWPWKRVAAPTTQASIPFRGMVFRGKTQRAVGWRCTTTRAWKEHIKTKVGEPPFVDPKLAVVDAPKAWIERPTRCRSLFDLSSSVVIRTIFGSRLLSFVHGRCESVVEYVCNLAVRSSPRRSPRRRLSPAPRSKRRRQDGKHVAWRFPGEHATQHPSPSTLHRCGDSPGNALNR
jgi:hypothetical protein